MDVTLWGVRGSIPTPQPENLAFGGETACVVLEAEGARLVLDAGSGLRRLGHAWKDSVQPVHILLSHLHWDHIQGIPYFAPLFEGRSICFHSCRPPEELHGHLAAQMGAPFFPVALDAVGGACQYRTFAWHQPFEIGPFRIVAFPLHHPQGSAAFRVEAGGAVVVYATDHEHGHAESDAMLLRYAQGAHMLIADAQYTPEEFASRAGFGHSTWQKAAELAAEAQVGRLLLFHHDPQRSDAALERIVALAREIFPATGAARERTTITLNSSTEAHKEPR